MARGDFRGVLDGLAVGGVLTFLSACLVLTGLQGHTGLTHRDVAGTAFEPTSDLTRSLIVPTVITGGLLLAGALSPWRQVMGLSLPRHHPIAGALLATVFTLWISTCVGSSTELIRTHFPSGEQDPSVGQAFANLPTPLRTLASVRAGVQEETLALVVPMALTAAAIGVT